MEWPLSLLYLDDTESADELSMIPDLMREDGLSFNILTCYDSFLVCFD